MIQKILVLAALLLLLSVGIASAQDDDFNIEDVDTAWQPFQSGVMMWFKACDRILVMMSSETDKLSGTFDWEEDLWDADAHGDPTDQPPSRFLHTPKRGFGHLWQIEYRDELDWGLAPELGYDSDTIDCDPDEGADEIIVDGPGDTEYELDFYDGSDEHGTWETNEIS